MDREDNHFDFTVFYLAELGPFLRHPSHHARRLRRKIFGKLTSDKLGVKYLVNLTRVLQYKFNTYFPV